MTWTAEKYARVLWELKMPLEKMEEALAIYDSEPLLRQMLEDPTVYRESKERIAQKVFPQEVQNVIQMLCANMCMSSFGEIVEAYRRYANTHQRIVNATLHYVTLPTETQRESLIDFLKKEFDVPEVDLKMEENPKLLGGFILEAEGCFYDWSLRGRFKRLQNRLK